MFRSVTTESLLGSLNRFEQTMLPSLLYYSGELLLMRRTPRIVIVGSRNATERGLALARRWQSTSSALRARSLVAWRRVSTVRPTRVLWMLVA